MMWQCEEWERKLGLLFSTPLQILNKILRTKLLYCDCFKTYLQRFWPDVQYAIV
jgi:hypothetical protein